MGTTVLTKKHVTAMGYSVVLTEAPRGGYRIVVGGRPIRKRDGEEMIYRGLSKAMGRFDREVAAVEGWEAQLKLAGKWHPIRLCAGGCGLEMRITPRKWSDGREETVEDQLDHEFRCVECGPFPPILFWKSEGGEEGDDDYGPAWLIPYADRNRFGREKVPAIVEYPNWITKREAKRLAVAAGARFSEDPFDFMRREEEKRDDD